MYIARCILTFILGCVLLIKGSDVSANTLACGAPLETRLSLIRSQLIAIESIPLSQKMLDQSSQIQNELNGINSDSIENCGKSQQGTYALLEQWSSNVGENLLLRGMMNGGAPECHDTEAASERWLTVLNFIPLRTVLDNYGISSSSDDAKHAEAPLLWVRNHLGKMPDLDVSWTEEQMESYQKYSHKEYLMNAASNPSQCTPPPGQLTKAIQNAGPGPTLIQTDAWLIENLPVSYFGVSAFSTVSQRAEYDINNCALKIDIDTHNTPLNLKEPLKFFWPLYTIEVKAASQSPTGREVKFGEWGHGTVNFREIKPDSIAVKTEDTNSEYPLALGYKDFDLAFREQDKAERVANALRRLAALCGAKNDPF